MGWFGGDVYNINPLSGNEEAARTVADQKNLVYFFDDSLSPELVWVDLKRIHFSEGTGVRKLTLHDHLDVGGDQTAGFEAHKPFVFLAPH